MNPETTSTSTVTSPASTDPLAVIAWGRTGHEQDRLNSRDVVLNPPPSVPATPAPGRIPPAWDKRAS